ncbi:MAG: ABC transporter ATP-binding protein [Candidatus Eiseniibacteriota bacterium]
MTALLEVRGLSRSFDGLAALDGVDLDVRSGSVHAVLGENGAGKSTLMHVLFGMLRPDAGTLRWHDREIRPASPAEALALGIGMVHQHFQLVDALTAWENVWLAHPARPRLRLDRRRAREAVSELAERFRLRLDPDAVCGELPVAARQKVEIAKALSRPCSLLILDEPTAVLAPPEARDLFAVVRELTARGTAVLFITHKLDEALAVSDRVTVLRRGRVTLASETAKAARDELVRAILGTDGSLVPAGGPSGQPVPTRPALSVRDLRSRAGRIALEGVSFDLFEGEILGVTGVDGNGQDELVEVLAGLLRPDAGSILLGGVDVTGLGVRDRWRAGLSVLPGDRGREGLLLDATLWENLALREFGAPWARSGLFRTVDPAAHRRRAEDLLSRHDVRAGGIDAKASSLSGGNQQKLLLARELAAEPRVLVLLNPTRGLDVGAAGALLGELRRLAERGRAVLLVSTELEEVLETAHRWAVMHDGELREAARRDPELLGAMMLGGLGP